MIASNWNSSQLCGDIVDENGRKEEAIYIREMEMAAVAAVFGGKRRPSIKFQAAARKE